MKQRIYFQSADPDFIDELDELKLRVDSELGDVIKMVDQTIGYADLDLGSDFKSAPTGLLKFFISECDDFCLMTYWSYPKEDDSNSTDIKTDALIKESFL